MDMPSPLSIIHVFSTLSFSPGGQVLCEALFQVRPWFFSREWLFRHMLLSGLSSKHLLAPTPGPRGALQIQHFNLILFRGISRSVNGSCVIHTTSDPGMGDRLKKGFFSVNLAFPSLQE
jgi:hypothetical protein